MTSANLIVLVLGYKRQKHLPKRTISLVNFGLHFDLDERYVRSVPWDKQNRQGNVEARRRWRQQKHAETKFSDTYSQRDHRSIDGLPEYE